jgi:hypothetical protein
MSKKFTVIEIITSKLHKFILMDIYDLYIYECVYINIYIYIYKCIGSCMYIYININVFIYKY